MTENRSPLPKYDNPPVIEVYCGITFNPIEKLTAPYVGLFWEPIKAEYKKIEEKDPLLPRIESFDYFQEKQKTPQALKFFPFQRVWFINDEENEILQLQQDQLLNNWRKVKKEDKYPHYNSIIKNFENKLDYLRSFLNKHKLGAIDPIQCELTYVNHITKKNGWDGSNNIESLFPGNKLGSYENKFLKDVETFNFQNTYVLPEMAGRLYVTIKKVWHGKYDEPIILFQLIARGISKENSKDSIRSWFDLAHESIVSSFASLTDETVQREIWRRAE